LLNKNARNPPNQQLQQNMGSLPGIFANGPSLAPKQEAIFIPAAALKDLPRPAESQTAVEKAATFPGYNYNPSTHKTAAPATKQLGLCVYGENSSKVSGVTPSGAGVFLSVASWKRKASDAGQRTQLPLPARYSTAGGLLQSLNQY